MSFTLILCFLLLLALAGAVCLVIQGIQARSWKKILLPILGYLLLLVVIYYALAELLVCGIPVSYTHLESRRRPLQ